MTTRKCVLFAGQSVQEPGMCSELWKIPAAREVLERLEPTLGDDIEAVTTTMSGPELALTFNAQRALHAHHLGHYFAYRALNPDLELDGAIGHSVGVVAALVAAGAMTIEESGAFIRARAQVFADTCKAFDEPMGMAAVSTDYLPDLAERIEAFPGVSLALHNTIGSGTIGGKMAALSAFAPKAEADGCPVKVKLLEVEGPYHTEAFAPCESVLAKTLESIAVRPPKVPVFMGTSGKLETEPEAIKLLLARQPHSLERHFDAVWAAYDHGCRSFLEVAHKPQPVTWIREQLQDEDGGLMPGVTTTVVRTADLLS